MKHISSHGLRRGRGVVILMLWCSPALAMWGGAAVVRAAEPPAAESDAELKAELKAERNRLWAEAQRLRKAGELAEALAVAEPMLAIERRWLGDDHSDVVYSLEWIASVCADAAMWDAAERWRVEAQAWREKNQGVDHWQTIDARLNLKQARWLATLSDEQRGQLDQAAALRQNARGLFSDSRYAEALQALLEELVICRSLHGEESIEYADLIGDVGDCYSALGEYAQALPLFEESLAITRNAVGEHHPKYAYALRSIARLHGSRGDRAAALPLYEAVERLIAETLGEKHAQYAWSLVDLGVLQRNQGELAKAEKMLLQALSIRKAVYGEQNDYYASTLVALGDTYHLMGDLARAISHYREALEIRKAVLGARHRYTASTLSVLALLYDAIGDHTQAGPLHREAVDIYRETLGAEHPQYAASVNKLAMHLQQVGDYAEAGPLYEEALAIFKKINGEESVPYATALNNYAQLCVDQGDYQRAEPLFVRAIEIRRATDGETSPGFTRLLQNLANLSNLLRDVERAEQLYLEALEIDRRVLGERHPDYAMGLHNLASLYNATGEYARAEPLFQQALDIFRETLGGQHASYASTLHNLGVLSSYVGDLARAESRLLQALAIRKSVLGDRHPAYAATLNELGGVFRLGGDYRGALEYYDASREIRKAALGVRHPDYATSLVNLARLHGLIKNYDRAESLYLESIDVYIAVMGEFHERTATVINNLGLLYVARGDYQRAEAELRRAVELFRNGVSEYDPSFASALNNLALLYDRIGQPDRAEPLYREAFELTRRQLESTSIILTERQQLAYGQTLQHFFEAYLSFLVRQGRDEAAFRLALAWKGSTLVRQRAARLAAESSELAPLFAELQATVRKWAALAQARSDDADWQAQLAEVTVRKEQLEAQLASRSEAFRQGLEPVTLEMLLAALPEDSAIVDFVEYGHIAPTADAPTEYGGERRFVAFVVRPGAAVAMFEIGPASPVSDAIDQWRVTFGMAPQGRAAGQLLREMLWQPLGAALGDARLVLVSPDGALGRLPLGALPGKEPGTYLIEEVTLALVPVPQLIPALVNDLGRRELAKELMVLGGVDYDSRAGDAAGAEDAQQPRRRRLWERRSDALAMRAITGDLRWQFLAGTDSEAAFIAQLYQQIMQLPENTDRIVTLRGAAATEEQFRFLAPQSHLLHVATHGFFAAENVTPADEDAMLGDLTAGERSTAAAPGLLSGLVFAGANVPMELPKDPAKLGEIPDDGILTAEEIAFLPLGGAELVVLSACESGLGQAAGGEGLLGIQRAFQVAGARTTIATLWMINDEATRRIMEEFYRYLLKDEMSPLEALRAAQIWALNNPSLIPRGSDPPADDDPEPRLPPQFWAAFTLSGDWR